jgi:hypothetical protein
VDVIVSWIVAAILTQRLKKTLTRHVIQGHNARTQRAIAGDEVVRTVDALGDSERGRVHSVGDDGKRIVHDVEVLFRKGGASALSAITHHLPVNNKKARSSQ